MVYLISNFAAVGTQPDYKTQEGANPYPYPPVITTIPMTVLAKFKAFLAGTFPPDAQKVYDDLRAADVPISDAACRSCPHPCDQGE